MSEVKLPVDIISFWQNAGYDKWFNKDDTFDATVREQFLSTYEAAAAGRLNDWDVAPEGALALIIVLDQFPRNMFRGSPKSWATDPIARDITKRALAKGFDKMVPEALQTFFYLPLMHSEEIEDQQQCVELYKALGDENSLKYAEIHEDIIRRFGRFPHRNPVLGRDTTPEEKAFLKAGGFDG
ncbi:DUF924 family protein [Pseudorhodoplanes sinuspersici]|uniref:Uncharacterized protein n=1 Tax=Pseudorhodoplanes sinuspersici TaxID=1235591 RepID=A0A1W6ZM80_9HYPH|nr:DUF924 family protein [Pseudorhodoplanes sinuspersici]ARP98471.1 hypothetical protein CAK95_04725 [Pseudorhodoplanes sinuspersici]RKE66144.1 uncharacterized protein (DUF924 family) [Pseudorhodoplanes sinuspersici]